MSGEKDRAPGQDRGVRVEGGVQASAIITGDGNTVLSVHGGTLHVHQAPPEAPRAPAPPARPWTIQSPSAFFTGREAEVAALRAALGSEKRAAVSQIQAVSGLGGIGKTQLALAYAQRHRGEYEAGFFVLADSELSLRGGLDEMARLLGLGEGLKPADLLRAVRRWLENSPKGLLILDNADSPQLVKALCTPGAMAHILVTTRAWNCTPLGVTQPVRLQALSPEASVRFFLQRTGREEGDTAEQVALNELAAELGHLPLALEQAGAYIAERDMRAASYLAAFRQRRAQLLRERPEMGDYPESVATTWAMNIQEVRAVSAASAALIEMSAFLAPDAIPEELLLKGESELGPELAEALAGATEDDPRLDEALAPLLRYSIINRDRIERTYSIHRLVQAVVRDGLAEPMQLLWVKRIVRVVARRFPSIEYHNWAACERLTPHARVSADWIKRWGLEIPEAGLLLNELGCYLRERGQHFDAALLLVQALVVSESALGSGHPDVATTCNNLAQLYLAQGKYDKVEPLFLRALAIRENALGPDHPSVAATCNDLAALYQALDKYTQAEPLFLRALAINEKALGPNHPSIAAVCNNLALLYRKDQDKHAQAKPLFLRALAIKEKTLGSDHPSVATTCNNLALLYRAQGRYDKAEPLFLRALAIREKALGPDHPDFATTCHDLALLYRARHEDSQAKTLFLRALAIKEKTLGPDHPDVATTLRNLAGINKAQGKDDEAESLYLRALAINEQALGPEHPRVANTLGNLASLYETQGRHEEAESMRRRAHAIRQSAARGDR